MRTNNGIKKKRVRLVNLKAFPSPFDNSSHSLMIPLICSWRFKQFNDSPRSHRSRLTRNFVPRYEICAMTREIFTHASDYDARQPQRGLLHYGIMEWRLKMRRKKGGHDLFVDRKSLVSLRAF